MPHQQRMAPTMGTRGLLLCTACPRACAVPLAGCSHERNAAQLALYIDPQGKFDFMLPVEREIAPEVSAWKLFAVEPSQDGNLHFDATVGLTWGRPPCDWMQDDDVVGWYVDRRSKGAGHNELSRVETGIDGRLAVQVEYEVAGKEGASSRETRWFTEDYGAVWQVTCTAAEVDRYDDYMMIFTAVGQSLRVYGSWSPSG